MPIPKSTFSHLIILMGSHWAELAATFTFFKQQEFMGVLASISMMPWTSHYN